MGVDNLNHLGKIRTRMNRVSRWEVRVSPQGEPEQMARSQKRGAGRVRKREPRRGSLYLSALVVAVILVVLAWHSLVVVESGTVGVVSTLGEIQSAELEPGIHVITPFAQKVRPVETRACAMGYGGAYQGAPEGCLLERPALEARDRNGLRVGVGLSVQYQARPDQVAEVIRDWGWNWPERLVDPIVSGVVRDVMSEYLVEEVVAAEYDVACAIRQGIAAQVEEAQGAAVQVGAVQLTSLRLPRELAQKVNAVQAARLQLEKAKLLEERAAIEQKLEIMRAETAGKKWLARLQAEREAMLFKAQGEAEAVRRALEPVLAAPLEGRRIVVNVHPSVVSQQALDRVRQQTARDRDCPQARRHILQFLGPAR